MQIISQTLRFCEQNDVQIRNPSMEIPKGKPNSHPPPPKKKEEKNSTYKMRAWFTNGTIEMNI